MTETTKVNGANGAAGVKDMVNGNSRSGENVVKGCN